MTLREVYKEALKFVGYISGVIGALILFAITILNGLGMNTNPLSSYNTLNPDIKFLLTFFFLAYLLILAIISIFFIYIIYKLVEEIDKKDSKIPIITQKKE